jgi:flagellar motor switch protein FliG
MGPEAASEVLRRLDVREVRQVSQALARARAITPEQVQHVADDFRERGAGPATLSVDGQAFARTVVTKALADSSGAAARSRADILSDLDQMVAASPCTLAAAIDGVPPEGVAKLLETEHPQIVALILASVEPEQAIDIIRHLPEAMQGDMIERLARLDTTVPTSLVTEVSNILREQVRVFARESGTVPGGTKVAAEVMKQADKTLEERIFESLEQRDPELTAAIRAQLFTFEDLMQLDNRGMQALLKEVAREDLLLSLKTASPELAKKIFANVSSRAAEILREDLETAAPARLTDVEAAQGRVIATMRELEAEGKIVLAGTGAGGDALV